MANAKLAEYLNATLNDFKNGCNETRENVDEESVVPQFNDECDAFLSNDLVILTNENQRLTTLDMQDRTFVKVDTMNGGGLDGFISWKISENCYAFGFETSTGRVRYFQCEGEGAIMLSSEEEDIGEGLADVNDERKFIISQSALTSGWCIQPYIDRSFYIVPSTRDILAAEILSAANASMWIINE